MDNISKIDLAVGLDLEQLKRDKDKAEALVKQLTEVNRKIETTFEIKLLNDKEIKAYAKNLMSSIQSDFNKALKEQEKESRDSINRRYKTEEQLFIKHSNYLSQLQDKINKETNESIKKALQERYNLANNANFGSEAELSKFKGKTEKFIAFTRKEAQEELSIKRAKNNTIRQLEEKLAGETRAIYRKSYQDRIQYISNATIRNREELNKTLSHIRVMAKQADNEFNKMSRSYRGVLSNETGTTFGHKFLTTSQYAISGLALLKVREAMSGVIRESMAYDDAIYNNMTVLQANRKEAEMLTDASRALAITYGGNIKDIDELTLTLGRAGVEVKNLKEATQASVELATITGDSFKDASEVTSSFITTFIKNMDETGLSVGKLADKLGYVANASRLSVKDLGTVGNYALLTSQKLNLTTDATGALITSFSNLGMNASTIGTSFRRLDLIFSGAGFDKVFKKLGETQDEWRVKIRENSDELINFGKALKSLSVEEYEAVTKGMNILAKNTLDAMRNGADIAEGHLLRLKNAADLSVMAQAKAMGATTQMQRIANAVTTSLDGLVTKILDFSERSDIQKLTEEYNDLSKQLEKTGITQAEITDINERLNVIQGELEDKVGSFNDKLKTLNSTVANTVVFIAGSGGIYLALKGLSVLIPALISQMVALRSAVVALGAASMTTTGAITALSTALSRTPLGLFAIGAGAVATAIFSIGSNAKKASIDIDNLSESLNSMSKKKLKLELFNVNDEIKELEKNKKEIEKTLSYINDRKSNGAVFNEKGSKNITEKESELEDITKRINDLLFARNDIQDALNNTYSNAKKDARDFIDANRILQESEEKLIQARRKANEERLKNNGSDYEAKDREIEFALAKKIVEIEKQKNKLLETSSNLTDEQYDKAKDSLIDAQLKLQDLTRTLDELNDKQSIESAKEDLSYYERRVQLQTDSYEKEKELASIAYASKSLDIYGSNKTLEEKQRLIELESELYAKTLERMELDRNTEFNDTITGYYTDMLNAQINLTDAAYDFGDAFGDAGNKIAQTTKALTNMANTDLKYKLEKLKIDKKYEEQYKKFGKDTEKGKKLEKAHNLEIDKIKKDSFKNDLASIGELAGAAKGFFKEKTAGYKILDGVEKGMHAARLTMMAIELPQTLALTQAKWQEASASATTAVADAGTGDPYGAPARVALMVGLMTAAMTMFGGKGGVSSAKSYTQTEIDKFNIEAEYTPMLDRLDRQIELLEKIERNGSAGAIKVESAALTFEKDYKLLVNEFLPNLHDVLKPNWGMGAEARALNEKQFEDMLGFNLGTMDYRIDFIDDVRVEVPDIFRTDKDSLKQDFNLMRLVETINANWDYFHNSGFGVLLDKDWKQAGDPYSMTVARIGQITNDMQELLQEYAISLLDSMQDLKDAKEKYIEIYEELTDTTLFTDKKLTDAFGKFNSLLKNGESYSDYIYKEINNLQNLEKFLTNDNIETLLSQDPTKLRDQLDLLDELKRETGLTFENGAKDALNYLESIKLVSEALVASKSNMMSFIDSFRSEDMLLNLQASKIGVEVATSIDMLVEQFKELSSDMFGLTDEELEYLNASKSMIEKKNEELLDSQKEAINKQIEQYEEHISNITKNISKLESIINSMTSTIDKLRGAVTDGSASLEKFYVSMKESMSLSKTKDYDSFEKSVKETISYSSALFEKSNFSSLWDMQFAQVVAANQFEAMQIDTQTEIDYLKQIEENTRNTVLSLKEQLEKMTDSNISSNDKLASMLDEFMSNQQPNQPKTNYDKVQDLYTKYDLHQFQSDTKGYEYWANHLNSGMSLAEVENNIKKAAKQNLTNTNTKESVEWLKRFGSFAVGTTNVPYDMMAQIHKAEMIVPATFSEGLRTGDLVLGDVNEQVELLKEIRELLQKIDSHTEDINDREDYKLRQGA